MKCPKCKYLQNNKNTECIKCGVIFAKLDISNYIVNKDPSLLKSLRNYNKILKSSNNETYRYKTIYKCINNSFSDLVSNNLKNEKEFIYFNNLIKDKLKNKAEARKYNPSILLAITILLILIVTSLIFF